MKQILLFTITLFLWLPTLILAQQTPIEILDGETQITNKDISDTQTYLMSMKVNPVTGQIPLEDVFQARQTADKLAQNPTAKSSEINWEFMGPNNIGGRTHAILIDKDNSQRIIAGCVSGGIFTSNNGGLNWNDHPQNQEFATLSISAIVQTPNGDIYIGTGVNYDGRAYGKGKTGNIVLPGNGMYKSTDGGTTFHPLETTIPSLNFIGGYFYNQDWACIKTLAVSPVNNNHLYAATSHGLQVSEDGGNTWFKPNGIPSSSIVYDVEVAIDGRAHVLADDTYYQAHNGFDFTNEFTGQLAGQFEHSLENKNIAISPSDNNYLYIVTGTPSKIVEGNTTTYYPSFGCLRKVWQSKNGGNTWEVFLDGETSSFDPMYNNYNCYGQYSLCLSVDPHNSERIFLGSHTLWSWSADEGWKQLDVGESSHPINRPKTSLAIDPEDSNTMYIGTTSGIAKSANTNSLSPAFTEINEGYFTAQLYGIAANINGQVMGGAQSNGIILVEPKNQEDSSLKGTFLSDATGGFCEFSKLKPSALFAAKHNGAIMRTPNSSTPLSSFFDENTDCVPHPETGECYSNERLDGYPLFITPFTLWEDLFSNLPNEQRKSMFITGACDGAVWMTEEALNFSKTPTWRKIGQFQSNRCISAIAVSYNGKSVFIGTDDGRMLHITDIDNDIPTSNEFQASIPQYISSIAMHSNKHIIVGLGNYGLEQNVIESFNATSENPTFTSLQHNLPLMPVYSVAIDVFNPNNILVGTELGVWQYDGTSQTWTENNGIMGRVPVHSLRFEQMGPVGCEVLYAGTHGRGIYRTTDFTLAGCNTDIVGIDSLEEQVSSFQLFPNPMETHSHLKFNLTEPTALTLQIFDLQGRVVHKQNMGILTAQSHQILIEKGELTSGIYYVQLQSGNKQMGQKLLVK